MGKISKKFNWLLILSVSFSVVISSFATTAYLVYISEKNTHDKNIIQVKGLSDYIREYLNSAYILNRQLSLNPVVAGMIKAAPSDWGKRVSEYNARYNTKAAPSPGSGPPLLQETQSEYKFIDLIYVQDRNGDQCGRSYGPIGHRKNRWWFKEFTGRRNLKPFISRSYFSLTGNKPVTSIFHPVMDSGEFLGIIGMDIDFSALQNNVEKYLNTKDMYAVVVDNEGVIIAHPDRNIIRELYNLRNLTKQVLKRDSEGNVVYDSTGNEVTETVKLKWPEEIKNCVAEALDGKSGYRKNIMLNGTRSTLYYHAINLPSDPEGRENYAVLLIQSDTAIVHAKTIIIISTLLLIVTAIILLFVIFHSRFRKFILDPLQVLIDSMNNVDIDNFQLIELDTGDEFSLMASTYNELRKKLAIANKRLLEKIELLKEREAGYRTLSEIGLALTTENDLERLLELILKEAMRLTNSDGGTLYIHDEKNRCLDFRIIFNESLNIRYGGLSEQKINFPPVPLYIEGEPNYSNVSSYAALTGEVVNIPDVYTAEGFDFSGTKKYDESNGYRSKSMLVIPMMNRDKKLIGVLQLINARNKTDGSIIPYSTVYADLISSLAYQAAVKMTNVQLHIKLQELLYSVIKSIASAIDEKSPFTGKHISNVYRLTMMIAEQINRTDKGYFKDIRFSATEMEELKLAAWMHDIGKITTPESLLNKGTKLQSVRDGIELIETRFQLIRKIYEKDALEGKIPDSSIPGLIGELESDLEFLKGCNDPELFMSGEKISRLKHIAEKTFSLSGKTINYLTVDELENLSIKTGTLNEKERRIIEDHVRVTQTILEHIAFPDHISNVPEYASKHHEKLDGTGYHRGLKGDEIPLQARIIAIADIFEALTAKERPYKRAMDIDEVLNVLNRMKDNNYVDPEVFRLIVEYNIGEEYLKSISTYE